MKGIAEDSILDPDHASSTDDDRNDDDRNDDDGDVDKIL